ncbi:hypothetical protein [Planococcus dechangensis]|uniref:Uncharacterized protein n=1 Tax=Planococcus dechangensis TaxID=1176255 RepID=A0ABV9MEF6_9BACL
MRQETSIQKNEKPHQLKGCPIYNLSKLQNSYEKGDGNNILFLGEKSNIFGYRTL